MEKLKFYKATGPDGLAHYDGKTPYVVGERLSIAHPDLAEVGACGRGLHVVSQLAHISNYLDGDRLTKSEFYEVEVDAKDVIAADQTKARVRSLRVVRRIRELDLGIKRGQLAGILGYKYGYGDGSGYGSGYGYGDGYGSGSGYGDGSGE